MWVVGVWMEAEMEQGWGKGGFDNEMRDRTSCVCSHVVEFGGGEA